MKLKFLFYESAPTNKIRRIKEREIIISNNREPIIALQKIRKELMMLIRSSLFDNLITNMHLRTESAIDE